MAAVRYVHTSTGGNQDGATTGSEVPRTGEGDVAMSGDAVTTGEGVMEATSSGTTATADSAV
ncbi:hypothetical protein PF008_g5226 [Phytophthora fragariae]|uniref:Uncharacterized protein n=1 Tax=Phytophthora fragariae TaxID=53985 RepID=A0A6G0SAV8_9STRA|nr:hypothetical protein PF008_g5226 [Phytophthora fragariae]